MPQTPLTDQTLVGTTNAGAQFAPAVAALSGGGYVIVWQDFSAGRVFAQRYSATGQPVGNELHLDSTQGGSPLWVSVAATANDGFVIAFQAGGFAQAEIYGRYYDGLNNPVGGLFAVNSTSPNEQFNPHITTLDGGALLFTWDTQAFDVFQEVRGRVFLPNGQALGADFVIAPMSATDQHGLSAIAPLPGGGFVVTWQRAANSGTNFEIVGQRFTSTGNPTGAEFQVNTQTANGQYGNDVARLSDGGFIVSWIDPVPNNGGGRVVARHYDASGNPIGGEIFVDGKASGAYGRTVVTALADGGYVVGWIRDDSADDNVLARAFDSHDQPQGAAFEMSSNAPFNSNFFSDGAVTLANGNVVFTWDGPSTNTGEDVYFRMYAFSASSTPTPVNGGPGADVLNGSNGDDVINGLGGDDTLNGLGGNDLLDGGPGSDSLVGGGGNDIYILDDSGDVVSENAGEGLDTIYTSVGYTLGDTAERVGVNGFSTTYDINLTGNAGDNEIWGNDGRNVLDGGAGADIMRGFAGDDVYIVDNVGDQVVETSGLDTVYTSIGYALGSGIERLGVNGSTTTYAINLTGNGLDNEIWGNDGVNLLDGGAGADIMHGNGGDDIYIVDNAGDVAVDSAGLDTIYTSVSYTLDSTLERLGVNGFTTTYAINLTGNELANELWGNDGVNILDGRLGADILRGNGGADTFAFTTALGSGNVDQVVGFEVGVDKIALDDAIFTGLATGALAASAFRIGAGAQDADDRIIYDSTTGALYFDADGNGAGAAVQFATLHEGLPLTASDFSVI